MYILDSDTLDYFFDHRRQFPKLYRKVLATPFTRLFISVISVEEAIAGAEKFKGRDILKYYEILTEVVPKYCLFRVLPYDQQARAFYLGFDRNTLRIGKDDCKIGATALSLGYTVVTHNLTDFSRIPGLNCEDWTV